MIRPPAFWWQDTPSPMARVLTPLGSFYGALALRRMKQPGQKAGCPVICIGNFTTGGSGKTPVAIHIARRLIAGGHAPMFLSRGYGGRVSAPTRVDLAAHRAADVGDEPLLLGRVAPVIVSPDRVAGAALARCEGASVIIMDDGLQNPSLQKDLTLAVVDGQSTFGNGLVFPAGPLRAPVTGQLAFVDAAIVIGGEADQAARLTPVCNKPLIRAVLEPPAAIIEQLQGRRVLAMAGIGVPAKFEATLANTGATLVGRHFVADHAAYSGSELERVAQRAAALDAIVATTEKDAVRIGAGIPPALAERLVIVPVAVVITAGEDVLARLLDMALGGRERPPSAPDSA